MSDGLFEGKRTTIVLLPHSVVFVNVSISHRGRDLINLATTFKKLR
jgi:hypothetical protein